MITLSHDLRIWLCAGHTDMRKGFDGLAALVQHVLSKDPFAGQVFVFRGRRGDRRQDPPPTAAIEPGYLAFCTRRL